MEHGRGVEEGCMAQGIDFSCSNCGMMVGAWDDGNPYYIDRCKMVLKSLPRSKCKVYVYHPHMPPCPLDGNDVPHLCLDCGHEFNVDTELNRTTCTKCRSSNILDCCRLNGRTCPSCRDGTFEIGGMMIS